MNPWLSAGSKNLLNRKYGGRRTGKNTKIHLKNKKEAQGDVPKPHI